MNDKYLNAAREYLNSTSTVGSICKKHHIRASKLQQAISLLGGKMRGKNDLRMKNIPAEELKSCIDKNMSIQEMADLFNVGRGTISNYCTRYGFKLLSQMESRQTRSGGKYHVWTDTEKELLIKLLNDDLSYDEISAQMGIDAKKIENFNQMRLGIARSQWERIGEDKIKAFLEESRDYDLTAAYFNVDRRMLAGKNFRDWGIDLSANSNLFGTRTVYAGVNYRSKAEAAIAKHLVKHDINFEYEKKVCEGRTWTCDFYLTDHDYWVEYDGLGEFRPVTGCPDYDNHPKIDYYESSGRKFIILSAHGWKKELESLIQKIHHGN